MSVVLRVPLPTNLHTYRPVWTQIFMDVAEERGRQERRWGTQRHDHADPHRGPARRKLRADGARIACDQADAEDRLSWEHILIEEVFEALAEDDLDRRRIELVQVMAVATAELEQIYEEVDDPCMSTVRGRASTATPDAKSE